MTVLQDSHCNIPMHLLAEDHRCCILIFESGLEDAIREVPSSLIVSEGHKMLRL